MEHAHIVSHEVGALRANLDVRCGTNLMSTISIHSEIQPGNARRYRAIAGNRQMFGATRGEALDALTADWGDEIRETVIVIERFEPDAYFTEAQQQRKRELM